MEISDYTGKPCRTKMAYEFLPKRNTLINLEKASEELKSVAIVEVKTKILLILKINFATVSLFPSGKILVRGEREEAKAKEIAKKILESIKESVK
ncbi:MAG: hypothetical protein PHY04_01270 [Candidatus ainarchaeum sp.]|jgi:ribonuclease HIII|nr:hypothetical protein [Candidatus ainarchaeum sp.]MDD3085577.1 hypothetical protein [Candidatus ainarchaeum sp.]MDD4128347.1 hypothetical protein [Candidatus ainarchaeum sp.]MDD4467855.1 hypothetical protein [Candidatus ainarchaeum sp.]HPM85721.1 hypothetical protein [archaeon]